MAENIELKAVLSAQDDASPVIKALIRQVQKLERLQSKANDPAKNYAKLTGAAAVAGRTAKAHETQAASIRTGLASEKARVVLGSDLRRRLGFESRMQRQRMSEERRGQRQAASAIRSETAARLKMARASIAEAAKAERRRYAELQSRLRFQSAMSRQRAAEERAEQSATARQEAAHRRQLGLIERENRARRRAFASSGRTAAGGIRDAANGIGNVGLAGAAAAGGGAYVLARRESEADAAEVNSRIYGGLDKDQARASRHWARATGIDLGLREADLMGSYTDALKLGLKDSEAKQLTGLNVKLAEGFGMTPEEISTITGKQVAVMISNGGKFDYQQIYGIGNAYQHLAAETAADPRELVNYGTYSVGGAKALGMDPRYAAAFGVTGLQQGLKASEMAETLSFIGARIPALAEFEKQQGVEGQRTRKLTKALGYGSVAGMRAKQKANPNDFVRDMFDRFDRIKDPSKRNEALRAFFGTDRFDSGAAIANSMPAYNAATKLVEDSKTVDAIDRMWNLHTTKLTFIGKQIDATFGGLLGSLGELVGPGLKDVGRKLTRWIEGNTKNVQVAFYAATKGLVAGLLGRDGSFGDLFEAMFGNLASNPDKFYRFFRGFGEGLRQLWAVLEWIGRAVKSFVQGFAKNLGLDLSDPEKAGTAAAQILGGAVGAKLLEAPAGIAKDTAIAGAAGVWTASKIASALGIGSAGAAAVPLGIGAAATVAVGNWDEMRSAWKGLFGDAGWSERRKENDAARARGEGNDPIDNLLTKWFGGAFGRRSSTVTGGTGQGETRGYAGADRLSGADLGSAGMPNVGGGKVMLDAIARAEGTAGRGDYSASLGYGRFLPGGREQNLTEKTLAEVYGLGVSMRGKPGNPNSSAMGRYQITGSTMRDAAAALGMDWNTTKFDAKTQDAMGEWIARKQGLSAWEGFKRNPAELATAKAAMAGAPTINVPALTGASAGRQAGAVDVAGQFLGMSENGPGRRQINTFLRSSGFDIDAARTAWCSAFVNGNLRAVGIKGTGSMTASSFLKWGNAVDPSAVAMGDVLVEGRGRRPGQTGAHVGLATGETRQGRNGFEVEMISGNSGPSGQGAVRKTWESASSLSVRRAASQVPSANALASRVPQRSTPTGFGSDGLGGSGGGGSVVNNYSVTVNGANQSPQEIARAVEQNMRERARFATMDVEYDP